MEIAVDPAKLIADDADTRIPPEAPSEGRETLADNREALAGNREGFTEGQGVPGKRFRRMRPFLAAILACLTLCLLVFASCSGQAGVKVTTADGNTRGERVSVTAEPTVSASAGQPLSTTSNPTVSVTSEPSTSASSGANTTASGAEALSAQVERKLAAMSLEEKVAQLFIVRPESITGADVVLEAGAMTEGALGSYPVGGFVYFAANLQDTDQTRDMLTTTQRISEELTGLPMFLCVDEEGGTVSRVGGNDGFPVANQGDMRDIGDSGDTKAAYDAARSIGSYLVDLGFTVDFAPVADIVNGTSDTMAQRSFGTTASQVAPMVAAQVRGFADAGILCSAKHFPGIGCAEGDSHASEIYSYKTLDEIYRDELVPFQAAIEEDVPFIMVGHLDMPAIVEGDIPSSLSSEIISDLLRERMRYQGIVITDSLGMGAVYERYGSGDSAIMAFEAGADMLLMPPDFHEAYARVLDAVLSGQISESRVDDSVRRILQAKLAMDA